MRKFWVSALVSLALTGLMTMSATAADVTVGDGEPSETHFTDLTAAIVAADGDTVTLTSHITLTEGIVIAGDSTVNIDGNNHTLYFDGTSPAIGNAVFGNNDNKLQSGTKLNVENLTLVNTAAEGSSPARYATIVAHDTDDVEISYDNCTFQNIKFAVYINSFSTVGNSLDLRITNCNFENGLYGYGITEASAGVIVGAVNATFTGNTGDVTEREISKNIFLDNGDYKMAYKTLQEAITAAEDGDSITFNKDITLTEGLVVPTHKAITINGNGNKLIYSTSIYGAFKGEFSTHIPSGTDLTLRNIHFLKTTDTNAGTAVCTNENVTDVSISLDGCTLENLYTGVYMGHIEETQLTNSISITNCTYKNTTYGYSIDEQTIGSIVDGVNVTFTNNTGVETLCEPWSNIILDNGSYKKNYGTLPNAIAAAGADTCTITLNKNADITGETVEITGEITMDLNGNTLYLGTQYRNGIADNLLVQDTGKCTILGNDGTIEIAVDARNGDYAAIVSQGILNLEHVTIDTTGTAYGRYAVSAEGGGTVHINGGSITADWVPLILKGNESTATVTDATLTTATGSAAIALYGKNQTVTVTDSTLTATVGTDVAFYNNAVSVENNCMVTIVGDLSQAITSTGAAAITFNAGVGSCNIAAVVVPSPSTLSAIPTPTLSGYRFNGWTADHMDGYVSTTTVFSANATTLTASYSKNATPSTSTPVTPDTTTSADGSVSASVSTSTSTSGSTTTATVTDSKVEAAIEAAVEAAAGETAIVEIPVSTKSSTDTVSAVISADAVTSIADSNVESLVVSSAIGTLTIPSDALSSIADQADGEVITITVAQVVADALADAQQAVLTNATIVDLTVMVGERVVSSFGGAEIAVAVPYALQDGEDATNIVVWYIADDGAITPMETVYDTEAGIATFRTSHFSVYAIIHDTNNFTDVDVNAYYYDAVQWAVANEITGGKSDAIFAPNDSCTRAQAVTFLWRAAGEPASTMTNPFSDLDEGAYYYNAVLWAVENGITTGFNDGTFRPNTICNRGQIVTFLHRAAGEPAVSGTPMHDVTAGSYCYNAVLWATENGITTGYDDGTFRPNTTCNRGQIVTFLHRYLAD